MKHHHSPEKSFRKSTQSGKPEQLIDNPENRKVFISRWVYGIQLLLPYFIVITALLQIYAPL